MKRSHVTMAALFGVQACLSFDDSEGKVPADAGGSLPPTGPAGVVSLVGGTSGGVEDLLVWSIPATRAPTVGMCAQKMRRADFGLNDECNGDTYKEHSAFLDTFAKSQDEPTHSLRDRFLNEAGPEGLINHPSCVPCGALGAGGSCGSPQGGLCGGLSQDEACDPGEVTLVDYRKPYEYRQDQYLAWLRAQTGSPTADFVTPRERGWNDYQGGQDCPLVTWMPDGPTGLTPTQLKQQLGEGAFVTASKISLFQDNRFNPSRWLAPIDVAHYHEQPSWMLMVNTTCAGRESARLAFRDIRNELGGAPPSTPVPKIFLDFDLELIFENHIGLFDEAELESVYGGVQAKDLHTLSARADHHAEQIANAIAIHGHLSYVVDAYRKARLLAPTFQLSLSVNFHSGGGDSDGDGKNDYGVYQAHDFLLASYNYGQSFHESFHPGWGAKDGAGAPSASDVAWGAHIREGGVRYTKKGGEVPYGEYVAFQRMSVDAFNLFADEGLPDPRVTGLTHTALTSSLTKRINGTLDLTRFYRNMCALGRFPGQVGYWADSPSNFLGQNCVGLGASGADVASGHTIASVGVIFESHGPFLTRVDVRGLRLRVAPLLLPSSEVSCGDAHAPRRR